MTQTTNDEARQQETADAANPPVLRILTELIALYRERLVLTKEIARAELRLSLRCIGLTLGLGLLAIAMLAITWIALWCAVAYGLFALGAPPWLLIVGFLLLQLLALGWLLYAIAQLLAQVGFQHTQAALIHPFALARGHGAEGDAHER